uniref:CENP-V/GFA domain-containing protein n=1 Tax=Mycena chlorophos TaxID=658473 RepID=A0ABQ0LXQ4_MYCCL|nr:predicted protein [Mycena chlorophos]
MSTYFGNCHCGAFKFRLVASSELKEAAVCDCSICSKKGHRLHPVRGNDGFIVTKGDVQTDKTLTTYTFGNKEWRHKFCKVCGTLLLIQGPVLTASLRAIQNVDLDALPLNTDHKGSELEPIYRPPTPPAVECPPGSTRYTGGCHCGAITYTLIQPDSEKLTTLSECNCSICSRNGPLHAYIATKNLTVHGAETGATEYRFGSKQAAHTFCKTCGVAVYIRFDGPEDGLLNPARRALNARTLNGVDLAEFEVTKANGKGYPPEYVVPE